MKRNSEHPILFSAPMVVAILEGRKTQTRRVGDKYKKWRVGDRLWVKETSWIAPPGFAEPDGTEIRDYENRPRLVGYDASMGEESKEIASDYGIKKTPSVFMPRWASRINLEVEGVRQERLCNISKGDADAEGVGLVEFPWLWNKINGKKPGMSWLSNPLVWVIQFKKL